MKTTHVLPLLLAFATLCPLAPAQEDASPTPAQAPVAEMKTEKWTGIPESFFMEEEEEENAFLAQMEPEKKLSALGIRFPEGASAAYSVARRTLTVTNTAEELKAVDKIVEQFLRNLPEEMQMSWKLSKSFIKKHKEALREDARALLQEEFGIDISEAKLIGSKLTATDTEANLEELDMLLQEEAGASKGKKKKVRKARKTSKTKAKEKEASEDESDAFESDN